MHHREQTQLTLTRRPIGRGVPHEPGTVSGALFTVAGVMEMIFMTLGSVNFPNIMLPALSADGSAALLYFYPYLYFSVFVYLNILLVRSQLH